MANKTFMVRTHCAPLMLGTGGDKDPFQQSATFAVTRHHIDIGNDTTRAGSQCLFTRYKMDLENYFRLPKKKVQLKVLLTKISRVGIMDCYTNFQNT